MSLSLVWIVVVLFSFLLFREKKRIPEAIDNLEKKMESLGKEVKELRDKINSLPIKMDKLAEKIDKQFEFISLSLAGISKRIEPLLAEQIYFNPRELFVDLLVKGFDIHNCGVVCEASSHIFARNLKDWKEQTLLSLESAKQVLFLETLENKYKYLLSEFKVYVKRGEKVVLVDADFCDAVKAFSDIMHEVSESYFSRVVIGTLLTDNEVRRYKIVSRNALDLRAYTTDMVTALFLELVYNSLTKHSCYIPQLDTVILYFVSRALFPWREKERTELFELSKTVRNLLDEGLLARIPEPVRKKNLLIRLGFDTDKKYPLNTLFSDDIVHIIFEILATLHEVADPCERSVTTIASKILRYLAKKRNLNAQSLFIRKIFSLILVLSKQMEGKLMVYLPESKIFLQDQATGDFFWFLKFDDEFLIHTSKNIIDMLGGLA